MSKKGSSKTDQLFNGLTLTAFEFLEKSLNEFEDSPKFSVIHFAFALELFFKARLMLEHWSLLVEKTDSAQFGKLLSGESKTVNPKTALQRLRDIAQDPLPKNAEEVFGNISEQRNKAIHFGFHSDKANNKLDEIVGQQCQAWRHLQELFEKQWSDHFNSFSHQIKNIEQKMAKHRQYLSAKFNSKKSEIELHLQSGEKIIDCDGCGFDSMIIKSIEGAISIGECLVCHDEETIITLTCHGHKCHQEISFKSYSGPPESCPSCSSPI